MIKTVIVNRFIDMYRKRRKFGVFISPDAVSDACRIEFENEDLSHRQKAIIARYLYNLNTRDKKIWELYMDGFTQKQMAMLMNWDPNGVAAVCHRIKQKLLKTIKG
jgi:DNA-directed RNA polymerase specialized sigma24 family protein